MKKLLILLIGSVLFFSCKDEDLHEFSPINNGVDKLSLRQNGEADLKLKIIDGYASSEETVGEGSSNGAFKFSYDGNLSSFWHSKWLNGKDNPPFTATWILEDNVDELDYALFIPRDQNPNSNGAWQVIDVYVATASAPNTFKQVLSNFNCVSAGYPTKIEFSPAIQKPKAVRVVVKKANSDFATCSEFEVYQKNIAVGNQSKELKMGNVGFIEPDKYAGYGGDQIMHLLQYTESSKIEGKVFLKFEKAGNAKIEILVKNDNIARNLNFKFHNVEKQITVPKTNDYEWVTLTTAKFDAVSGYTNMTLRNLSQGDIYIEKVRITGDVCDGVSFNDRSDNRRNAVSVHLGYRPEISNIEWFYNEVTIPEGFDKPYHTFYMTGGWNLGYSGLQTRDDSGVNSDRWLLFSCWNSAETNDTDYWAKIVKMDPKVSTSSFGGEGTGAKTYIKDFNWKTGKTYCFLTQARVSTAVPGSTAQRTDTTFYSLFWKEKGGDWNFQATIMSPYNGRYLSGLYSFVENFVGMDGQYQRKATFHNQWVKNAQGWSQVLKAELTADEGRLYRNDFGAGVDGNGFFLWNGGYMNNQGWHTDIFTRNSSSSQPLTNTELANLASKSR